MASINLALATRSIRYWNSKRKPVFLWGPPGVGKSDIVHQIAREDDMGMVDFRAVLRDPVDLRGIPMPDVKKRTAVWLTPDELPQEKRDGKRGILFLDELNAAHQQTQAACFGLVLDRKLGDYKLPEGWVIIAAGNRQSDRSAAQRMPRALANRFAHLEVEVDHKQWIEDYAMANCHELIVSFIRFRPELLHNMEVEDERMFPTPRSWTDASEAADAPDDLRFTLISSKVGDTAAAEFEAFIRTYRELPDMDDIINHPTKTPVPYEPSALYAVSTALGRYADRDNFAAIMVYAQRLSREYEIIIGLDATKREPMLTKTKAYIEFQQRNKDLMIGNFKLAS